jgi:hypothetical protein
LGRILFASVAGILLGTIIMALVLGMEPAVEAFHQLAIGHGS